MSVDRPLDVSAMLASPRCGAKTRSGNPCHAPTVRGKRRCRMHGGAPGTGPPVGNANAFKHGRYARPAIEERRELRELLQSARYLVQRLK